MTRVIDVKVVTFLFYRFRELESTLPNIAIQVIADVKESSAAHGLPELSEEVEVLMRKDIVEIGKPDYKIKQLVRKYALYSYPSNY